MKIGSDISLFATNALSRTQSAIARSLQRLSTGLRVNSPQDDMAAFSEGVTLDSSIRGYSQAIRNLNDATGVLNTASSAISTQIEIVQKMRELAVQASNGTLSSADRANLNTEAQALYQEFQRITSTTQFNGVNLLDGSFGTQTLQVGTAAGDNFSVQIPSLQASSTFIKTIGSGTFQPRITFKVTSAGTTEDVAYTDINGDGKPDFLTIATGGTLQAFLNEGNGIYSAQTSSSAAFAPVSLAVGDINGDGVPDVVTADFYETSVLDSGVSVFLGNGDGTFKPKTVLSSGRSPASIQLADLNHDGKLDMIVSNETDNGGSIGLYFGNGDGSFKAPVTIAASGVSNEVRAVDLNGDGNLDLEVNSASGLLVFLGNANGTFGSAKTFSVAAGVASYGITDLNRDGKLDLVYDDAAGSLWSALGNGDGSFGSSVSIASGSASNYNYSFSVNDLNGDGIPDIATVRATSGDASLGVQISIGKGDGTFTTTDYHNALSTQNTQLYTFDVNGDGVPDVVSVDGSRNTISRLLANTSTVSAQSNINLSTQSAAQTLLPILDNALTSLKADQATLAASQVRLDQANSYSVNMVQNLSDARSSALNVDIAAETSQLVRNQILEQAQVAVVGQANVNMQLVLGLLKNLGS